MRRFAFALAVALVACSKPEPPVLVAKEARLVAVSVNGLELRLRVEAQNPNSIPLQATSVHARVTMDQRLDLGALEVPTQLTLPAKASTELEVPITMKWADVGAFANLAAAGRPVPFSVDGSAKVGGEHLNVDVPFHIQGVVTPQQLVDGAMRSLPAGLLPPAH